MRRVALSLGPIVILAGHAGCSPRAATPPPTTIAAPAPAPTLREALSGYRRGPRLSDRRKLAGHAGADPGGRARVRRRRRRADAATIDTSRWSDTAVTTLASYPEQALALADGRVGGHAARREPGAGARAHREGGRARSRHAASPTCRRSSFALAESGDTLLVTSGWAHTLSVLSSSDSASRRAIPRPAAPAARDRRVGRRPARVRVARRRRQALDRRAVRPDGRRRQAA